MPMSKRDNSSVTISLSNKMIDALKDYSEKCGVSKSLIVQIALSQYFETKEKTTYRPFRSCNELVYYWEREKVGYSANPLQMIDIWVKHKVDGRRRMIVGFGENFVEVGVKAKPVTLERLLETYTFLDGEPCGVKEDKF